MREYIKDAVLAITIGVLLLITTGCATTVPQVVKVPVTVPCTVSTPTSPVLTYAPGTYKDTFALVRDLKGDRSAMLGYETELEAALKACK